MQRGIRIDKEDIITIENEDTRDTHQKIKIVSRETGISEKYIMPYITNWHKIDGNWYMYKGGMYYKRLINELLGEIISDYFKLDTVHYQIARKIKNGTEEYGIISKSFYEGDYTYKKASEYGIKYEKDLSIIDRIRDICQTDKDYLMLLKDIKKLFIRDFYTSQFDRSDNNLQFKQKNNIRLAPLYDYEYSFDPMHITFYRNRLGELNLDNRATLDILKNDEIFKELINSLMDTDMKSFVEMIEDAHQIVIGDEDREYYQDYENEIKKLVLNKIKH